MDIKDVCTGFQHLGLPTRSMDATLEFYRSIGFEPIYNTVNDGCRVYFLKLGDMVIETYESGDAVGRTGAIDHISLNVKDVEAVFSRANELGLKTDDKEVNYLPFFDNGVRFFTVFGPNGEKVEFNQIIK